jgi:hypothetical protein
MVILKVGHHLYDGHHLFGTKQQRSLGPSRDEQCLGFSFARWMARWSAMGRWVAGLPGGSRCRGADYPRLEVGWSTTWQQKRRLPCVLSERSALWARQSTMTQDLYHVPGGETLGCSGSAGQPGRL